MSNRSTSHTQKDARMLEAISPIDTNVESLQTDIASLDTKATGISDDLSDVGTNVEQSLTDTGRFELSICGRFRIYPREPSQTIVLATDALADTYGVWTQVIAADTVTVPFHVVGVLVEAISATGTYMIQFGDCGGGLTPVESEIQGEIRFVATAPVARSTVLIPFGCRGIDANRRVMARTKNNSGGDNVTISVSLRRYVEVSQEVTPLATWPW